MTLYEWVIPIRLVDLIEIVIVAYVLYRLYLLMRGTIAVQLFLGLMALYGLQAIVTLFDMTVFQAFFGSISEVIVLAVIILFQPELRRLLQLLGQNPLVRRFVSSSDPDEMVDEVIEACEEMSKKGTGALLVFERTTGLRSYTETGASLHARVTSDLLVTIFYAQNPLHDGAVIIRNRRIEAARCILPVSSSRKLGAHLGLRHRAGVGITEQTDAFVVIVSEESSDISIAKDGELVSNLTTDELRRYLSQALAFQAGATGSRALAESVEA
ncbi:MAG: TIGR00159 family protein [Bacteroidetes bacterium QS_8_64_10]|nr:MAG: TIGR00159 family protein [Bacteroidetes bacterium QS_8_64_10]